MLLAKAEVAGGPRDIKRHDIGLSTALNTSECLAADGAASSDLAKAHEFYRVRLARLARHALDQSMALHVAEMLTMKARHVANENHATDDSELLGLFLLHTRGSAAQKSTLEKKLLHVFLTIDQRDANSLRKRLSALRRDDVVSVRFHSAFPPAAKAAFLWALQITR